MVGSRPVDEQALLRGFVDTTLAADHFHHEQHVHVAWLFVRNHGMPAALAEFTTAIKRFAAAKGAHGLYHETITWAFLLLIAERQARCDAASWGSFAATNPDLLVWKPSILERYYSRETLKSDLARRTFLFPDPAAQELVDHEHVGEEATHVDRRVEVVDRLRADPGLRQNHPQRRLRKRRVGLQRP